MSQSSVKVAVRVRPLNQREHESKAKIVVAVNKDTVSITNLKNAEWLEGERRKKKRDFVFDYCFWSVDPRSTAHASQQTIFDHLGVEVLDYVFDGYNSCVLAYGQSGSGKTYTMFGSGHTPDEVGLIPRVCKGIFEKKKMFDEHSYKFKISVSYMEIYNEHVFDLLADQDDRKPKQTLKIREHPKLGPYVQDLSENLVADDEEIQRILDKGNDNRSVAATQFHQSSSRGHAIFTLLFSLETIGMENPTMKTSKVHLVDLAGSERASSDYDKTRLQEGANINKSLVTLGSVISSLAERSIFQDNQANEMESSWRRRKRQEELSQQRQPFIPYRDSTLTWLLKDTLGGNSKTFMIATVSPSSTSYYESMSTLRYAQRAKRIVNKPVVNEDPNLRIIRELRQEIIELKLLLGQTGIDTSQALTSMKSSRYETLLLSKCVGTSTTELRNRNEASLQIETQSTAAAEPSLKWLFAEGLGMTSVARWSEDRSESWTSCDDAGGGMTALSIRAWLSTPSLNATQSLLALQHARTCHSTSSIVVMMRQEQASDQSMRYVQECYLHLQEQQSNATRHSPSSSDISLSRDSLENQQASCSFPESDDSDDDDDASSCVCFSDDSLDEVSCESCDEEFSFVRSYEDQRMQSPKFPDSLTTIAEEDCSEEESSMDGQDFNLAPEELTFTDFENEDYESQNANEIILYANKQLPTIFEEISMENKSTKLVAEEDLQTSECDEIWQIDQPKINQGTQTDTKIEDCVLFNDQKSEKTFWEDETIDEGLKLNIEQCEKALDEFNSPSEVLEISDIVDKNMASIIFIHLTIQSMVHLIGCLYNTLVRANYFNYFQGQNNLSVKSSEPSAPVLSSRRHAERTNNGDASNYSPVSNVSEGKKALSDDEAMPEALGSKYNLKQPEPSADAQDKQSKNVAMLLPSQLVDIGNKFPSEDHKSEPERALRIQFESPYEKKMIFQDPLKALFNNPIGGHFVSKGEIRDQMQAVEKWNLNTMTALNLPERCQKPVYEKTEEFASTDAVFIEDIATVNGTDDGIDQHHDGDIRSKSQEEKRKLRSNFSFEDSGCDVSLPDSEEKYITPEPMPTNVVKDQPLRGTEGESSGRTHSRRQSDMSVDSLMVDSKDKHSEFLPYDSNIFVAKGNDSTITEDSLVGHSFGSIDSIKSNSDFEGSYYLDPLDGYTTDSLNDEEDETTMSQHSTSSSDSITYVFLGPDTITSNDKVKHEKFKISSSAPQLTHLEAYSSETEAKPTTDREFVDKSTSMETIASDKDSRLDVIMNDVKLLLKKFTQFDQENTRKSSLDSGVVIENSFRQAFFNNPDSNCKVRKQLFGNEKSFVDQYTQTAHQLPEVIRKDWSSTPSLEDLQVESESEARLIETLRAVSKATENLKEQIDRRNDDYTTEVWSRLDAMEENEMRSLPKAFEEDAIPSTESRCNMMTRAADRKTDFGKLRRKKMLTDVLDEMIDDNKVVHEEINSAWKILKRNPLLDNDGDIEHKYRKSDNGDRCKRHALLTTHQEQASPAEHLKSTQCWRWYHAQAPTKAADISSTISHTKPQLCTSLSQNTSSCFKKDNINYNYPSRYERISHEDYSHSFNYQNKRQNIFSKESSPKRLNLVEKFLRRQVTESEKTKDESLSTNYQISHRNDSIWTPYSNYNENESLLSRLHTDHLSTKTGLSIHSDTYHEKNRPYDFTGERCNFESNACKFKLEDTYRRRSTLIDNIPISDSYLSLPSSISSKTASYLLKNAC